MQHFAEALKANNLRLTRAGLETLQVNLGLLCNQSCKHCHLEAGPARTEIMNAQTAGEVAALAARIRFATADLTGGAPELNPNLPFLVEGLRPLVQKIMVRANLTALGDGAHDHLFDLFARNKVAVVASLASPAASQTDAQRGKGTFEKAISTLKNLNSLGYGKPGGDLVLDLVSNPAGAFLPPAQAQAEKRFRQLLADRHQVVFNNLYTFANVPLGRFGDWLKKNRQLRRLPGKADRSLQPLRGGGADVPQPGVGGLGRLSLRLRFQPGGGASPGGRKDPYQPAGLPPRAGQPHRGGRALLYLHRRRGFHLRRRHSDLSYGFPSAALRTCRFYEKTAFT